ncbi:acyl-CoA N-acyltransferase [Cunninghamella echinulata]|nr:acyl-CoA N-acyltransferase [Cunninghamella echinulata]
MTYPLIDIQPATVEDVPLVLEFIKLLADYEKLTHEVVATEELLKEHLFGKHPKAEVIFAYYQKDETSEKVPAGFALFFHNFSTFLGRPGLYLEDLFVKIEYRGVGLGKKLLTHLANIAKERQCGRYEFVCLNWNKPSRQFYEGLGAAPHEEWIIHRFEGKSLDDLANM